jgi:DNA-binding NtrC family response regulator
MEHNGALALVVDPEFHERLSLAATMMAAGLRVKSTDSFKRARSLLLAEPPLVLVTAIRLGSYNGLHLAYLGRSIRPHMIQLVTSSVQDCALKPDAEAVGATFVWKPMTDDQVLAALYRTMLRDPNADGSVAPPHPPLDRCYHPRHFAPDAHDGKLEERKGRQEQGPFLFLQAWRRPL